MAEPRAWRIEDEGAPGSRPGAVLAVDFAATGRLDAGFSTLMKLTGTDRPLFQALPPEPGAEHGMRGSDYVDRWAGDLPAAEAPVHAVLGNCASSPFALALAERIGTRQDTPATILFDPTVVTPSVVLRDGFDPVVAGLKPVIGPAQTDELREAGRQAATAITELTEFTAELLRIYSDAAHAACAKLGLPSDRAAELAAWFRSYLHYLVAASELEIPSDLSAVTVLRARDVPLGLVSGTPEHCFEVDHADLLGDTAVAAAVARLL